MTSARNRPPRHIWETLMRLRAANKSQLADTLGVNRHTLARWITATESGESPGKNAEERAAQLLRATLHAANSDVHAQWAVDWDRLKTVGGKR